MSRGVATFDSVRPASPRSSAALGLRTIAMAALVVFAPAVRPGIAAEVHSNGLGGGDWSDPLSWREKVVPGPEDDAVISRGDTLAFDRNDDGKTTCKQLFIDPGGTLTFKIGCGQAVCCPGGAIESFGAIVIDAAKSSGDKFELRLVGPAQADRTIKLMKGGKLAIQGRRSLAHGKHNAAINAFVAEKQTPVEATVEARDGASVELQRAEFAHVHFTCVDIDNTGAEVGERLTVVGNHFTGLARISLTNCDSAVVADNLFELGTLPPYTGSAMYLIVCPLVELRNNTVRGRYGFGVQARQMVDSSLTGGEFEGCATGVYWYGTNGMLKQFTARKCDTGLTCTSMSGVVDDVDLIACKTGYYHAAAHVQVSNIRFQEVPADGVRISFDSGTLKLLNCDIKQDQIVINPSAAAKAKDGIDAIESLYYLIVGTKGKLPAGARVEVRTAAAESAAPKTGKAARAPDPNVRNSPAPLRFDGLTPLPDSLEPLIVRGWKFDDQVKPVVAPSYTVGIVPAATEGAVANPIASMTVKPDATWYRPEPNKPEPTVEITAP